MEFRCYQKKIRHWDCLDTRIEEKNMDKVETKNREEKDHSYYTNNIIYKIKKQIKVHKTV